MERPLGPRPPPSGDRNRAFESIFGRPSAVHHLPQNQAHLQPSGPSYARAPSPLGYSNHRQPQYHRQDDPRFQQQQYPSPAPQNPYPPYRSQSFHQNAYEDSSYNNQEAYSPDYPRQQQQSAYPSRPPLPPNASYIPDNYSGPSTSNPPVTVRHSISHTRPPPGMIAPRPSEPPDLIRPQPGTITPAQAYQAQYQNPPASSIFPHSQNLPPGAAPPHTFNGRPSGQSSVGMQRSTSVQQINPSSSRGASPYLPPVPADGSLGLDDYLSDPSRNDSRRYPLRAPLDSDAVSLAESIPQAPPQRRTGISEHQRMSQTSVAYSNESNDTDPRPHRRSNDSVQTVPYPGNRGSVQYRPSTAEGARPVSASPSPNSSHRPSRANAAIKKNSLPPLPRPSRPPYIYPALLSRVAEAFLDRITLAERVKDGLAYKDAFDGREAVTKIAEIIKTTDRNLALLLGRALDAQKFFHDVTYDHRLRDSSNELFQFRTALPSPFTNADSNDPNALVRLQSTNTESGGSGEGHQNGHANGATATRPSISPLSRTGLDKSTSSSTTVTSEHASGSLVSPTTTSPTGESTMSHSFPSAADDSRPGSNTGPISGEITETQQPAQQRERSDSVSDEAPLPSGVFTLLTDCYSPTCTRDRLCYSIACPRRLEQQARLNMQPQPGLRRTISRESLGDLVEPGALWIHSVSQEIADSLSDREKKRQEAINEVMYTERDFVRDMEYLRDQWMKPLSTRDIIPESKRADFVIQVFWNVLEIISVNTRLRDALTKRQKQRAVVESIGDVLIDIVPLFEPFVKYGSHQLYGKYEFEKEKNSNPAFSAFVDEVERLPESRKLELNGYLTKPTTRLARYPLLLEVVLKYTEDGHPDKTTLPKVISIVRDFLKRVNVESGKTENRFNLLQLDQQLVFRPGEAEDLRLMDENRELVYKGPLKKGQGDNSDLQLFLFDHALLVVKAKSKHEQYKVYRKPIPLELLLISPTSEDPSTTRGTVNRPKSTLISKRNSTGRTTAGMHPMAPLPSTKPDPKGGFPITFIHLGRKGYTLTLWASTYISRKKWLDSITKQQEALRDRSTIFEPWTISQGFFIGLNRVNCAAPLNHGRRIVYGTDDGVYFSDLRDLTREPVKVLALLDVTQVDVLEEHQLLIVLSERSVITFPLEALDPRDPSAGLKRAKRVSSHTSFFKAGMCLGRMLVCVVKASALSTTIKTLEPIDQNQRGKNKPTFKKLLQGGNDTLRVFKEFYIPVESSSIHFLRTKLCVGCTKGFEIVDLETLDAQGLLDPNDASLDFVQKRENVRPMAIYRVESEFLLCYEDFAFYINKNGWRSRPGWIIHWEGTPTAFALHYPYVLAFEPSFIEIRHVETGLMAQVIPGTNLSCLFADTPPSANTASQQHHQSYRGGQPAAYGRQSVFNPYGTHGSHYPQQQHGYLPPRRDHHSRDEIILTMDDRVMGLRLALPLSDTASFTAASSTAHASTTLAHSIPSAHSWASATTVR